MVDQDASRSAISSHSTRSDVPHRIEEIINDLVDWLGRVYPVRSEPLVACVGTGVPLEDAAEFFVRTTEGVSRSL
jgi:hypothetical protein